jgi:hypothetical protein
MTQGREQVSATRLISLVDKLKSREYDRSASNNTMVARYHPVKMALSMLDLLHRYNRISPLLHVLLSRLG